jgi:L-seryl-tRNA(Ser) seleniumtransferase
MGTRLAKVPAVHRVLARPELAQAVSRHGLAQVREAVRDALAEVRLALGSGALAPGLATVAERALALLVERTRPAYPQVINATGVLIHTNLGRAPASAALPAAYLALEMELASGERGERLAPVASRLQRYFGAPGAMVVSNNAAALFLLLAAHASGREVVVSRGELVEIGGSFRLPELMTASGTRLVEVGCTNRTHLRDYQQAMSEGTAGILVVHRSNFHMEGFVTSPPLADLVALGRRCGVPVWVDQGSGCHLDLTQFGLRHEATAQEILALGADAVLLSGDKLLGGPQAGIVLGSARVLAPLRAHPLRRALRPDKSVLVGLAAVLDAFLAGRPLAVPLYRLLAAEPENLARRARALVRRLRKRGLAAQVVASRAALGGGTTPDQTLPSWAVALPGGEALARALRQGAPAVVAHIEQNRVIVDLRAVFPEQDVALAGAMAAAMSS